MFPAPYIIVGFTVQDDAPNRDAIIAELEQEVPMHEPPPFPLGVPDVYALRSTTTTMHQDLKDLITFFTGKNVKYGRVIRWFAQICDVAWIGME
jgi:hypothetical protein